MIDGVLEYLSLIFFLIINKLYYLYCIVWLFVFMIVFILVFLFMNEFIF